MCCIMDSKTVWKEMCLHYSWDWLAEGEVEGSFGSKYIKFGEKIAAKFADEVIVLSKTVQDYFQRSMGEKRYLYQMVW